MPWPWGLSGSWWAAWLVQAWMGSEWTGSGIELKRRSDVTWSPRPGHRRGSSEQNWGVGSLLMLTVTACCCWSRQAEGVDRDELDWLEGSGRGDGVLGWTGDRRRLLLWRGCFSDRVRGRPRPRFPSVADSGVDTDLGGAEVPTCWRFLTPLDCRFGGERSLVFWTWTATAASLNALGAVVGAAVSVILGTFGIDVFRWDFFGVDFFDGTVGEDGRIDANGNDGKAVARNDAWGLDIVIGLGHGPKMDVVDVSRLAVAAGVVVTAVFGVSGTI